MGAEVLGLFWAWIARFNVLVPLELAAEREDDPRVALGVCVKGGQSL